MQTILNALKKFFGVLVRPQTYLNMLYLMLAFPLGLCYFIFLVVGISVGLPMIILWVGLLILAIVFAVWYGLIVFERKMAIVLLNENIPPIMRQDLSGKTTWQKFKAVLGNPVTWKGLLYLLAKFPLGILSFVMLITLASISAALLAAPFYYQTVQPVMNITIDGLHSLPVWRIDTLNEALVACLAGGMLTLISMHIFNGLAWVSGKFARIMLGNFSTPAAAPTSPAAG